MRQHQVVDTGSLIRQFGIPCLCLHESHTSCVDVADEGTVFDFDEVVLAFGVRFLTV